MMAYKGFIKKSRTLDLSAVVALLGIFLANFDSVRDSFGDYSGWVFIGLSGIMALLRMKTTGPVGDK